jgi:hypothetical protein
MSTTSSIATTTDLFSQAVPPVKTEVESADKASGGVSLAAQSTEPEISEAGRALAQLYDAASAFVQAEHFDVFKGWKYDSAGYVLNNESAYMDVERYNNYLFDKAATRLVEEARQQFGATLEKKDVLAQLKAENANIAAIRFNDNERRNTLGVGVNGYANLTYSDVQSLTDMYITAKENGLNAAFVHDVAFHKGSYNQDKDILVEATFWTPEKLAAEPMRTRIEWAEEIKSKLTTTFGFEARFFEQLLNPRMSLGSANTNTLEFISQLLDIYNRKSLLQNPS